MFLSRVVKRVFFSSRQGPCLSHDSFVGQRNEKLNNNVLLYLDGIGKCKTFEIIGWQRNNLSAFLSITI